MSRIKPCLEGHGPYRSEHRMRRADGRVMWVLDRGDVVERAEDGRPLRMVGSVADITERKQAEDALYENEQRWILALEGAGHGVWDWNATTGKVFFSHRWKAMLGYRDDEVGDTLSAWADRLHPEDLENRSSELDRHFRGETPSYRHEHRVRCKDGSYKWILDQGMVISRDAQGQPLRVIGTHTDMSSRKELEEQMRQRSQYQRAVLDTFPFIVWLKDEQSRFLEVNAANARMAGMWTPEALVGKTDFDITTPELAERYRADDRAVLESGQPKTVEEPYDHEGRTGWLETYKSPVTLDGRVIGTVGFARDITDRKQIEERLRESEVRYRSVVSALGEGVILLGADYRIQTCNPAAERILGLREAQLLGMSVDHPAFAAMDQDGNALPAGKLPPVRTLVSGASQRDVIVGVRKPDGRLTWITMNCEPVFAPGSSEPAACVASFIDITDRRDAEEQLRKLSLAVEQGPNGIEITNLEYKIEYVNDALVEMTGYAREELLGRPAGVLASGDTRDGSYDAVWSALREGRTWRGELINRRKNGETYVEFTHISPVRQPDGRITHYLAIKEDVTERKRIGVELDRHRHHLEELVAERTEQLQQANRVLSERAAEIADLYNKAPCGYHSIDGNATYLAINDTELAWLGYRREEVVGRLRLSQVLAPQSVPVFKAQFQLFKQTGEIRDVEYELMRKDGSTMPVLMSATMVRDADGKFAFTRTIVLDNTERKARARQIALLNNELERRAGEAEAANRAKSAFLANMSHEIRTPMNAIVGLTHVLQERSLDPAQQDKLHKISDAARHLLSIINDVLDISKIEAGKLTLELSTFELTGVIDNVCSLVGEKAQSKGLQVLVDVDSVLKVPLQGDATRLSQALLNYLSNAVKFTEHGSIEVRARAERIAERCHCPAGGQGQRHRHRPRESRQAFHGVRAGRQLYHAQIWRHRSRTRHQPSSRATDGR
jgi:PAS domain S-box-containing protein